MNWWIVILAIISVFFFLITQYYRWQYESQQDAIEAFQDEEDEEAQFNSLSGSEKLKTIHNITINFKVRLFYTVFN
mgnify:CR=1 FL=1